MSCIHVYNGALNTEKQMILNSRGPKVSVMLNIAYITISLIQLDKSGRF